MNFRKTVARHPGVRWMLGAVEFTVAAVMMAFVQWSPAWAVAVSIPLADRTISIDLGDLPAWIVAFVAAGGFWKAWKAEQRAAEAAALAAETAKHLAEVGVKIDGLLVARDAAKVKEGEAKSDIAAGLAADQLQRGVEQGIAQERASVAAANPVAPNSGLVAGKGPVPVTDKASDRVADATEKLADAAQKKTAEKG